MFASFDRLHGEAVAAEFERQPLHASPILDEADLVGIPAPVARYVRASGAVGRPRPQNARVEFDAVMHRAPGDQGMRARSVQYNFFGRPARLFLMRARMFGLPVRALHRYREEHATFQVRIARLVNIVDLEGDAISRAETVTVLNDMAVLAPGSLVDQRLAWRPLDDTSAEVTFSNGPHQVTAVLRFNDRSELVDFWSDDRPETEGGRLVQRRWSTPLSDYTTVDGLLVPTRGDAVYARPDGPFAYGQFTVRSVSLDLAGPALPPARA
jgi:hypothetical protein